MTNFNDEYACPDCGTKGPPISDEASADEYRGGWHITCPDCGFSVSGPNKAIVIQAVSIIAAWNNRVRNLMEGTEGDAA
jgi:DNA-directed RNA polymerase subunit RPC12/RpoP